MALGGNRRRGISGGGGGNVQAPPTAPSNGSGGPGVLGTFSVTPAINEIGNAATGRITLAMLDFTILAMIGFYLWTRSAQGGG